MWRVGRIGRVGRVGRIRRVGRVGTNRTNFLFSVSIPNLRHSQCGGHITSLSPF